MRGGVYLGGLAELPLEEDPDLLLVLEGDVVDEVGGEELVLELHVGDLSGPLTAQQHHHAHHTHQTRKDLEQRGSI